MSVQNVQKVNHQSIANGSRRFEDIKFKVYWEMFPTLLFLILRPTEFLKQDRLTNEQCRKGVSDATQILSFVGYYNLN